MTTKLTLTKELTHREAATVLAALRHWQEYREAGGSVPEHFDHFDDAEELSLKEIDGLCETINLQPRNFKWAAPVIAKAKRVLAADDSHDDIRDALIEMLRVIGEEMPDCTCNAAITGVHALACPMHAWEAE